MPFSLRRVVTVAVPAFVMLFGFLWFRRRKKSPSIEQKSNESLTLTKTSSEVTSEDTAHSDRGAVGAQDSSEVQNVLYSEKEANPIEGTNEDATPPFSQPSNVSDEVSNADIAVTEEVVSASSTTECHMTPPAVGLATNTMATKSDQPQDVDLSSALIHEIESQSESIKSAADESIQIGEDCASNTKQSQSVSQTESAPLPTDSNNESKTTNNQSEALSHQSDTVSEPVHQSGELCNSSQHQSVAGQIQVALETSSVQIESQGSKCSNEEIDSDTVLTSEDITETKDRKDLEKSTESFHDKQDLPSHCVGAGDWSESVEQELNVIAEKVEPERGDGDGGCMATASSVDGATSRAAIDSPTEKLMSSSEASSDANSEVSNDSGKGTSVAENGASMAVMNGHPSDITVYEFNFPTELCGRLIGRMGKNINQLKSSTGAQVSVGQNQHSTENQIVVVQGTQEEIDNVLKQIRKKFPLKQYPNVDLSQIVTETTLAAVSPSMAMLPEIMQLSLPECVSIDVIVSSIVDAGHIFVQQPTHPTFPSLERLNTCMIMCYSQDAAVPQLPRPIDFGVICAAPMLNGWYRAQVIAYYEETDECDIKYVDYGGYTRIPASILCQIRSDFTTLPFQAVECYMANVTHLPEESGFSIEASAVLEEFVQGKLLQGQIVGQAEDGLPYVQIYNISSNVAVLVNRELVNRGVASWVELQ